LIEPKAFDELSVIVEIMFSSSDENSTLSPRDQIPDPKQRLSSNVNKPRRIITPGLRADLVKPI
jgi:hypothetical protein